MRFKFFTVVCCVFLQACSNVGGRGSETPPGDIAQVNEIADRYLSHVLSTTPEIVYFHGLVLDHHDKLSKNDLASIKSRELTINRLLGELEEVNVNKLLGQPEWITHAYLLQALRASVALRVCRNELWNVNQMEGWHSTYARIAQLQPVGTAVFRNESLARWSGFDIYIQTQVRNLQTGLKLGYSAPKTVVQRVIDQIDGLIALDIKQSPFYSPAARDPDVVFGNATFDIVTMKIYPALVLYRDFLSQTYINAAREALSVTANPNGLACYAASLQSYTTLNRSGKQVFELGMQTVNNNKAKVVELGKKAYGLDNFDAIIARVKTESSDQFTNKTDMLNFARNAVHRAELEMPKWVHVIPDKPVIVVPFEEHEEGTGRAAHYLTGAEGQPGEYRIPLQEPENQSRGNDEVTAFHETWPGHHLQVAIAQSITGIHPVTQLLWFSGPGEGWARYSEALAEEMEVYKTETAPILRRAWPARGMVVDPGIHLFGWTREQAIAFMTESGRVAGAQGDQMVDRIAIQPGQLTAYDSGGLEILALRMQAEKRLGNMFDIREFHQRILENGTIPLEKLRSHIETWIAGVKETNRKKLNGF